MRPSVSDSVCSSDWHLYLKRTSNAAYQFGASLWIEGGMQKRKGALFQNGSYDGKRRAKNSYRTPCFQEFRVAIILRETSTKLIKEER